VSGLIGASCKIRIKPGYLQPAHLFTAIVQKSGQSKSGTKEYMIDPLQDIQGEWHDDWKHDTERYEREMVEWKSAKKGERPACPIEPDPPKRIIVSDITIEAVGKRLNENPFGLLLYNDELDGFFANMGRYNNGDDVPHWLSIHNGKPLTIDRKGSDYIRIANPSVAIIGGVQPYIFKQRLKENPNYFHSGFLARFLLAMPPVAPIRLNNNTIPQPVLNQWTWFIGNILQQRESAIIDGKLTPHIFPIDTTAWNILTEYQHRHADLAISVNDNESALEGKFLTNTARIALILHVVNLIESGELLENHKPITGDTMESACIIAEWFIDESKRIYAELAGGNTPVDKEAETILTKIQELGGKATGRELQQGIAKYRPKGGAEVLDRKLREMVKNGILIVHRETAGNGRDVEYFSTVTP
jgi:hypothetical protein